VSKFIFKIDDDAKPAIKRQIPEHDRESMS
jgi:hypothetical protein